MAKYSENIIVKESRVRIDPCQRFFVVELCGYVYDKPMVIESQIRETEEAAEALAKTWAVNNGLKNIKWKNF